MSRTFDKNLLLLISKGLAARKLSANDFFSQNDANPQWEEDLLEEFCKLLGYEAIDISKLQDNEQKCESESVRQREIGNLFTKRMDYGHAIAAYTKSIASAPHDSTALALAFANRGAILKTMGHFKDSVKDSLNALAHGYPEHLKHKVYIRLGQCYQQMGEVDEAKIHISKAMEAVNCSLLTKNEQSNLKQKYVSELEECEESLGSLALGKILLPRISGTPKISPAPPPRLSYGPNKESSCLSKNVALHYTKTLGRHLIAASDIKPGLLDAYNIHKHTF